MIPERLAHGFEKEEFETRTLKAQRLMRLEEMDSLLLTTEPEVRYFSGFHTPFWQSPTRPWYLVVPLEGKPIAVIPEIGAERMASTWIDKIETWASPRPKDEGLTELSNILKDIERKFGRVGLPMGAETHVRMPFLDFSKLTQLVSGLEFVDGSSIVSKLRMIKSESEISKTRFICQCVSQSFQNIKKLAKQGDTEREIFRKFNPIKPSCFHPSLKALPIFLLLSSLKFSNFLIALFLSLILFSLYSTKLDLILPIGLIKLSLKKFDLKSFGIVILFFFKISSN